MLIEKGPRGSAHFLRRMGAAFTTISSLSEGRGWKGHHMMNFSLLSHKAWSHITRGAVSWRQKHSSDNRLSYRVTYPNGYGVSIIKDCCSYGWQDDLWELAILKDDELCYDTWITEDVCGYLTEEDVVAICDDVFDL